MFVAFLLQSPMFIAVLQGGCSGATHAAAWVSPEASVLSAGRGWFPGLTLKMCGKIIGKWWFYAKFIGKP